MTTLPVSSIRIEVAQFDVQKLRNPDIHGKGATLTGRKLDSVRYTHLFLVEEATTLLGRRKRLSSPLTQRGIQPQF